MDWIDAHIESKNAARKKYFDTIGKLKPESLTALGYGSSRWLDDLNESFPVECEFIVLDGDQTALEQAAIQTSDWLRQHSFLKWEFSQNYETTPKADVYAIFNTLSYLDDAYSLFSHFNRRDGSCIAVRQLRQPAWFCQMKLEIERQVDLAIRRAFGFKYDCLHTSPDAIS